MNRHVLSSLALLVSVVSASAQQPLKPLDPPELVAARAEHLRAMQRAAVQPLSSYLRVLESQQLFFSRQGKTEAATAFASEITTIKEELAAAQAAANLSAAAPIQLQIDKAEFGDLKRNRVIDVTPYILKAFTGGKTAVSTWGIDMAGPADPAPGIPKSLKVVYTINGKRKEKVFDTGRDATLDFKKDLK